MEEIRQRAKNLIDSLGIEEKRKEVRQIEALSANPSFWQDQKKAAAQMKDLSNLQKEISDAEKLQEFILENNLDGAKNIIEELETLTYLSGSYDLSPAILSVHAGQGGVEAMDWAQMLFRMYTRYFERKNWSFEIIDETMGEEAGVKSITLSVNGKYAYGYLKGEAGAHRLVRLSPFNADKLRHTSFALIEVMPDLGEEAKLDVKEEDLDWEFYRASSHGGQNVQKVSTAVRLKHKPTGIVVTAQAQRYQAQNRDYALKLLKAKLWVLKEEERKKEEQALKGGYKTPGWGNQIRSYVLHPYHMVKDLRTGFETSNTEAVLNGEIDGFIEEELRKL